MNTVCNHDDFHTETRVHRNVDNVSGKVNLISEIRVTCKQCNQAVQFEPVNASLSLNAQIISIPFSLAQAGPVSQTAPSPIATVSKTTLDDMLKEVKSRRGPTVSEKLGLGKQDPMTINAEDVKNLPMTEEPVAGGITRATLADACEVMATNPPQV